MEQEITTVTPLTLLLVQPIAASVTHLCSVPSFVMSVVFVFLLFLFLFFFLEFFFCRNAHIQAQDNETRCSNIIENDRVDGPNVSLQLS